MKNKIKYFVFLVLIATFSFSPEVKSQVKNDGSRYTKTSKLSTGKWIKLKTFANAIYKLSYDDIKKMGVSDPSRVKIYGSGGWILDEDFSKPYVDDLQEIAVYVNKGSDDIFGPGDYLLFYGRGTVKWSFDDFSNSFVHENNPYATYGVYFMTQSDSGPKETELQVSEELTTATISEYNDYVLYESDSISITNTGRELYGENFVMKNTRTFDFDVPGIISARFTLSFAAKPLSNSLLTLSANDNPVIEDYMPSMNNNDNYIKAEQVEFSGDWENPVEKISTKVYYQTGSQTVAFLNYIRLNTTRKLQAYGNNDPFFRSVNSRKKSVRFNIENAGNNHVVFDVTDPYNVRKLNTTLSGSQLSFGVKSNDTIREFALVDLSKSFPVPELLGEVQNQNLHGLDQTEMVILAPKSFLLQAETLANAHREKSGLHVTVVQADLIFNEFSSGVPDATAYRRFMKMFYDRAGVENDKPKYLLLFGDGIFDNRFKTPGAKSLPNDNYLLTYQVKESVSEYDSYGTDDYFGFLDDDAKTANSLLAWNVLDIGIGRFPASSMAQADNAVAKVIGYMNNTQYSPWKNTVIFAGDDMSAGEGFYRHSIQADTLSQYLENQHPEYNIVKVYEPAFKAVTVNGKKTYPDAKNKMMNALKNGCFLLNYTGHGNTTAWTSEDLLTISDVNQMSFENLPLWITATCDFGWFDGVNNSAGEAAFQNKKSGAIALYTTTRVVDSDPNSYINSRLLRILFDKNNRKNLRLGDVLRMSKNQLNGNTNKLNYALLGDPALRLNFPDLEVQLSAVNGQPVEEGKVLEFKALDKITLTGKIVDVNGNHRSDLNGNIQTIVFDSKQQLKSLEPDTGGRYLEFEDYTSKIYTGSNNIANGEFTVNFTVPLDISYSDNQGKLSFYAFDKDKGTDGHGVYLDFKLNSTAEYPEEEGRGPDIKAMYLNSASFRNGDKVNETPYFVAEVYDEDGINISGGSLGHEISVCIDNNPNYTFILNDYFESSSDVYGEGTVRFLIPAEKALPEGNHTLVFKVWDLLNNSSVDSLEFTVVKGLRPQLFDLTAIGNPARGRTYFQLIHDRPNMQLDVTIRVYDLTGRICWTHKETGSSDWLKSYPIEWNLQADNGMPLKAGVYVYRAEVRCGNSTEATKAKKIIILGQ
ncbi:peptidase C25 [Bacteroidia bacterium]|nr:peptidase C25 [Bacteroidia bacterium]